MMPPEDHASIDSTDRMLEFMYLPPDILRRFTNIESLIIDDFKQKNLKHPPFFVLNRKFEYYLRMLLDSDFNWENSILKQLDFIWPKDDKDKINATIWSLSKEQRSDVHNKATKSQKNFIYLPLHMLKKATNIHQLIRQFGEHRGHEQMDKHMLDRYVDQIHKRMIEVEAWQPILSGLKFLDGKAEINQTPSTSDRLVSDEKRFSQESMESDREKSVLGKQAKMFFNWMNPKKPTKRVHQNEQQQVNVEKNSSTLSNLEDKPDVSNETLDGQASQSSLKSSANPKKPRIVSGPSDFQLEINALSYDDFIEKTNIKELIAYDFAKQFNGSKELTPEAMKFGMKEYDRLRKYHDKWYLNSLKNLKFKECECKRKKTFTDTATHTDDVEVQDKGVQYSLLDFNANETVELERQSKMALLTINSVSDTQIISMQSDLQSPDSQHSNKDNAYITDDVTMNEAEDDVQPSYAATIEGIQAEVTVNSSQDDPTMNGTKDDVQPSHVATNVEAQTEVTAKSSSEVSEVPMPELTQSFADTNVNVEKDFDELNLVQNTDNKFNVNKSSPADATVNEADIQPSLVATNQNAQTGGTAKSSLEAPELAMPVSTHLIPDNDVSVEKDSGKFSPAQIDNKFNATNTNVENVNVNRMARAKGRRQSLKKRTNRDNGALRMILNEINQQLGTQGITQDLNRQVGLCLELARRK